MKVIAKQTVSVAPLNEVSMVEGEIFEGELNYENRTVNFTDRRDKPACFPFGYFSNLTDEEPVNAKLDPNAPVWIAYGEKQLSQITIRGIFAAIAMLGQSDNDESPERIADTSVKLADALINRLNQDPQ